MPLSGLEICLLAKGYLDTKGVKDLALKHNLPGLDWLENFSNKDNFSERLADNMKINRADVSFEEINNYFDNLEETLNMPIPVNSIQNYDETNICDNPASKKVP